jgi:hypothetical protein
MRYTLLGHCFQGVDGSRTTGRVKNSTGLSPSKSVFFPLLGWKVFEKWPGKGTQMRHFLQWVLMIPM